MDVVDAILRLVEALAWPVVVMIVALLFRTELRSVVSRLQRAVLPGGVSLDFPYRTESLPSEVSRKRIEHEQQALPEPTGFHYVGSNPLPDGEVVVDRKHGPELGLKIESFAISKLEQLLNSQIRPYVRLSKGTQQIELDGVSTRLGQEADIIVEVKWLRDPRLVRQLIGSLDQLQRIQKDYEGITGKRCELVLAIVVPQLMEEVLKLLEPLKREYEETTIRIFLLDYDSIGFSAEETAA